MDLSVGVDSVPLDDSVVQVIVSLTQILNLLGLLADDGLLQVDALVGLVGVGFKRSDCPVQVADS